MQTNPYGQTYQGADDFRGWLAANDKGASAAGGSLSFVGNDGRVDPTKSGYGAIVAGGVYTPSYGSQSGYGSVQSAVDKLYQQWQSSRPAAQAPTASVGYSGGYASGGGGGGYAAPAPVGDENTARYYEDLVNQLNPQLGQLDKQQEIGIGNILNSYNRNANRLGEQKAMAERDYQTNNQQNTRSYLNSRNGIMQNSRSTANALQRLLGLNGAANSSAALEQAPYAVGLQANQNLGQAQQTFGGNASKLETGWQDTLRGYNNTMDDLAQQKFQQDNGLKASIAQTRASLLDKIGSAKTNAALARGQNYAQAQAARNPYQQQVNDLLGQITNLGQQYTNPQLRAADVKFEAPELGQYSLGKQVAPTQENAGAPSDVGPNFLGLLTGDKEKDRFGGIARA